MEISPSSIRELNQKRDALRAEGFEFACDQPNTPRGRALIMSEDAALTSLGYRTRILKAVNLIDLWRKEVSPK